MSGDKRGGKLAEMQAMAKAFAQQGEAAQTMKKTLDTQASRIPDIWSGPGADRFKNAWDTFKKTFDDLQRELQQAQQGIQKSAQAIEAATR